MVVLGSRNGLELAIAPRAEKTIGKVILEPQSPDLIAGVAIEPLRVFADDRGFFTEIARLGRAIAENMLPGGERHIQVSYAVMYPGTIKAIHYHYEQTDLWAPVSGMLQVFLYDLRRGSKTFATMNTLYLGTLRPWLLRIPPGVGHGAKTLGTEPGHLLYLTDRHYNPADEGRLAYDHPAVAYDWETQHK